MSTAFRTLRRSAAIVATALFAATLAPHGANAQERDEDAFRYTGSLAAGRTVNVRNINGAIDVGRSTSGRVEVTAEKRWRRGDPDDVRIVQVAGRDGDIMVCALWNDSECTADGIRGRGQRNRWNDRNDVSVHFTVRVPDGVEVHVETVNGDLAIGGATARVQANTVNGSVKASSTGGPVRAKTVNGSINATMGTTADDDLRYETVNGSITLNLPASLSADLDVSTVNGSVTTDFPITVQGTISRKRLRGTVGDGGQLLRASTVNGSVTLRRAD